MAPLLASLKGRSSSAAERRRRPCAAAVARPGAGGVLPRAVPGGWREHQRLEAVRGPDARGCVPGLKCSGLPRATRAARGRRRLAPPQS
eukprot:1694455-Pyramimonas_sp.AAC.1